CSSILLQNRTDTALRAFREACSDVATPVEFVTVKQSQHQRGEGASFPAQPSADYKFLAFPKLHFHPIRTASGVVRAILSFGYNALQLMFLRHLKQLRCRPIE